MYTHDQREAKYETASELQKRLYDSDESGQAIYAISQKHEIQKHINFSIAIGDVILGLVPQEKLPDHLIESLQITRPEAMKVTADVLDFLAPLSSTAPAANATPITDNEVLEVEIAQAEVALQSSVQPIRTMAHDMETARHPTTEQPTHQSVSQADLLTGNQSQNPSATWDTTQTK